jgi:DNA-binding NarL/FixJ family response regulator
MWEHAEVVGLLDRQGCVRVVSRNEAEALIHRVIGQNIREMLSPVSHERFETAFQAALAGDKVEVLLAGVADEGFVFWGRVHMMASPETDSPVLFHMRRLPRAWGQLSDRESAVIEALNSTDMNAKRAARRLGISVHTLNSHRRSICKKCNLSGIGEFWIFVERCR